VTHGGKQQRRAVTILNAGFERSPLTVNGAIPSNVVASELQPVPPLQRRLTHKALMPYFTRFLI
jgi:hypothetical protein